MINCKGLSLFLLHTDNLYVKGAKNVMGRYQETKKANDFVTSSTWPKYQAALSYWNKIYPTATRILFTHCRFDTVKNEKEQKVTVTHNKYFFFDYNPLSMKIIYSATANFYQKLTIKQWKAWVGLLVIMIEKQINYATVIKTKNDGDFIKITPLIDVIKQHLANDSHIINLTRDPQSVYDVLVLIRKNNLVIPMFNLALITKYPFYNYINSRINMVAKAFTEIKKQPIGLITVIKPPIDTFYNQFNRQPLKRYLKQFELDADVYLFHNMIKSNQDTNIYFDINIAQTTTSRLHEKNKVDQDPQKVKKTKLYIGIALLIIGIALFFAKFILGLIVFVAGGIFSVLYFKSSQNNRVKDDISSEMKQEKFHKKDYALDLELNKIVDEKTQEDQVQNQ